MLGMKGGQLNEDLMEPIRTRREEKSDTRHMDTRRTYKSRPSSYLQSHNKSHQDQH